MCCCIAGPQYGTVERAWCAMMTEAEKVSDLHMEIKGVLMAEDFEKVKNWQKDAYHKQMIGGFKETKEAEDGYRKAQKPWAKKLKEVRPDKQNVILKFALPFKRLFWSFSNGTHLQRLCVVCSVLNSPWLTVWLVQQISHNWVNSSGFVLVS